MKRSSKHAVRSCAFSATLHTGLMVCVVWWGTPAWVQRAATKPVVQTIVAYQADALLEDTAAWEAVGADPAAPSSAPQVPDLANGEPRLPADSPGLAEFARKRFEQARRQAEDAAPEQQLDDLESLARRLERVSNEQSVQELTGTLSGWLGADERAAPAGDANRDGTEFDVGTAQISDVKQVSTDDGVTYVAVLVDARGNSIETPLDEADGPQLYKTFQLIKRFPLLESVYRKAVMGLLDKLAAETEQDVESERQLQPKTDQQQQE